MCAKSEVCSSLASIRALQEKKKQETSRALGDCEEKAMNTGYNGQNEEVLVTPPRSRHAVGGRATLPESKPTPSLTLQQAHEFLALVAIDMYDTDACFPWTGAIDSRGYGSYRWSKRPIRQTMAHRIAYILLRGPVPDGLELDHLCRNKRCCNPAHLEPVTHAENIRRRVAAKTHCKRGHEFTVENTRVQPKGRACKQCDKEQRKSWHSGKRR